MDMEVYKRRILCFILCNKIIEVYKRRIHCFILCKCMWKFIRGVYTVSYLETGCGSL